MRLVENEAEEYETDSGEEEEWWHTEVKQGEKVQVVEQYFNSAILHYLCVSRYFSPETGRL